MPRLGDPSSVPPEEALARLEAGNRRFQEQVSQHARPVFRPELADAQHPFAIVLGCADSRTPVELLFDQGLGDLFVTRVAGNIVAPSIVGSIEFAAAQFGARLVVVLGHTRCGAIAATARAIATGRGPESRNIQAITDRIAPHIEEVMARELPEDARLLAAMRANVRASASHLRHASPLLEELVLSRRLWVVGAEYELETGKVHFFDGLPKP